MLYACHGFSGNEWYVWDIGEIEPVLAIPFWIIFIILVQWTLMEMVIAVVVENFEITEEARVSLQVVNAYCSWSWSHWLICSRAPLCHSIHNLTHSCSLKYSPRTQSIAQICQPVNTTHIAASYNRSVSYSMSKIFLFQRTSLHAHNVCSLRPLCRRRFISSR